MKALAIRETIGQSEPRTVPHLKLMDPTELGCELPPWHRSHADELLNTSTHGFGFILAMVGAQLMTGGLSAQADTWLVAGCGLYLISLVGVYAMSTLSHAATDLGWKSLFRQLDQGFIYLLIVATYTPYSLAYLHGPFWLTILSGMWVIAIVGFTTKVFFAHRVDSVSVISYVLLGWIPIVSVPTLFREAPAGAFNMIIVGGLCYSIGTLFLINDERVKHFHAAWHMCVIAGSACHFYGLLAFVVIS